MTLDQCEVDVRFIDENSPAPDHVGSRRAEAEEREERLREDRVRHGQNGLRPEEGHYVRNDVLTDDETRSGTDGAGPFDELTFLNGQTLRADEQRGDRTTHDGN